MSVRRVRENLTHGARRRREETNASRLCRAAWAPPADPTPWWCGGVLFVSGVFVVFGVFGSCLRGGYDGGVFGEVEGLGLQGGWLGEFLERVGVSVQAGGVAGLGGELGQ